MKKDENKERQRRNMEGIKMKKVSGNGNEQGDESERGDVKDTRG